MVEEDEIYTRFVNPSSSHIHLWTQGNGAGQAKPLNARSTGRYLLIRFRPVVNDAINGWGISVANGAYQADYSSHRWRTDFEANKWHTLVIDLSGTDYEINAPGDTSVLLRLNVYGEAGITDISTVALMESLDEVGMLINDDKYFFYAGREDFNYGTYTVYDTATGAPHAHNSCTESVVEGETSTTYTVACSCGEMTAEKVVDASVNKYISAGMLADNATKNYAMTTTLVVEDGIAYTHNQTESAGHIQIWTASGAAGSAKEFGANTGNYLVIKYRTNNADTIILEAGTEGAMSQLGQRRSSYDATTMNQKDWEVAVISLADLENYVTGADDKKVQIRIDFYGNSMDIAYAAVVDTLEEAATLVDADSNTYQYYETFTGDGVTYDKTTNKE
jgi:hypothetical protein